VRRIVLKCGKDRQSSLFSATIPPAIETLITWAMRDPITIEIGARRSVADTVKHVLYPVAELQKPTLLVSLLERVEWESAIVFCRTRRDADTVDALLRRNNHKASVIHSDRSQKDREQALEGFKNGKYEVLVATDIAARGLDIPQVEYVINMTFPLTIVTFGLFLLVVNAAMIGLVASLLGGFVVDGLWAGIGAAVVTGIVSWIAGWFIGETPGRRAAD
jgi:ATP-dependent RNA helicase RhlE